MRRRIWIWIAGVVVVLVGAIAGVQRLRANADEAAFRRQLELAKAEGLPPTWQDFAATVPRVPAAENAAPFYRRLKTPVHGLSTDFLSVPMFQPTPANLAKARQVLQERAEALKLIDAAVTRPHCWFDRDWSQGFAVLFAEYAYMKSAGRLLALRGSLKADQGNVAGALADVTKIFVVARHAGEEPNMIAHVVEEQLWLIAVRALAAMALLHRDQPNYLKEIRKAIVAMPRPNLRDENRGMLYCLLEFADDSLTPEGRKRIGLRDDQIPDIDRVLPLFYSQPKARIGMVKAYRRYWAALTLPAKSREPLLKSSWNDFQMALAGFPIAAGTYNQLAGDIDPNWRREELWEAQRQLHLALYRALQSKKIPNKIKTSDLLSPFDGKPLQYAFDGKQMSFTVSEPAPPPDEKAPTLKFPPDSGFKMAKP